MRLHLKKSIRTLLIFVHSAFAMILAVDISAAAQVAEGAEQVGSAHIPAPVDDVIEEVAQPHGALEDEVVAVLGLRKEVLVVESSGFTLVAAEKWRHAIYPPIAKLAHGVGIQLICFFLQPVPVFAVAPWDCLGRLLSQATLPH